jgi:hypothetical protein
MLIGVKKVARTSSRLTAPVITTDYFSLTLGFKFQLLTRTEGFLIYCALKHVNDLLVHRGRRSGVKSGICNLSRSSLDEYVGL